MRGLESHGFLVVVAFDGLLGFLLAAVHDCVTVQEALKECEVQQVSVQESWKGSDIWVWL